MNVFSPLDERGKLRISEAIIVVDQAWQCFVDPQVSMQQSGPSGDGLKIAERVKVSAVDDRLLSVARAKERCITLAS